MGTEKVVQVGENGLVREFYTGYVRLDLLMRTETIKESVLEIIEYNDNSEQKMMTLYLGIEVYRGMVTKNFPGIVYKVTGVDGTDYGTVTTDEYDIASVQVPNDTLVNVDVITNPYSDILVPTNEPQPILVTDGGNDYSDYYAIILDRPIHDLSSNPQDRSYVFLTSNIVTPNGEVGDKNGAVRVTKASGEVVYEGPINSETIFYLDRDEVYLFEYSENNPGYKIFHAGYKVFHDGLDTQVENEGGNVSVNTAGSFFEAKLNYRLKPTESTPSEETTTTPEDTTTTTSVSDSATTYSPVVVTTTQTSVSVVPTTTEAPTSDTTVVAPTTTEDPSSTSASVTAKPATSAKPAKPASQTAVLPNTGESPTWALVAAAISLLGLGFGLVFRKKAK